MARFEKEGYEYEGYALGEVVNYWGNEVKIVGFDEDDYIDDISDLDVLITYSTEGSRKLIEEVLMGSYRDATFLDGLNKDLVVYWAQFREISKVEKED